MMPPDLMGEIRIRFDRFQLFCFFLNANEVAAKIATWCIPRRENTKLTCHIRLNGLFLSTATLT